MCLEFVLLLQMHPIRMLSPLILLWQGDGSTAEALALEQALSCVAARALPCKSHATACFNDMISCSLH